MLESLVKMGKRKALARRHPAARVGIQKWMRKARLLPRQGQLIPKPARQHMARKSLLVRLSETSARDKAMYAWRWIRPALPLSAKASRKARQQPGKRAKLPRRFLLLFTMQHPQRLQSNLQQPGAIPQR